MIYLKKYSVLVVLCFMLTGFNGYAGSRYEVRNQSGIHQGGMSDSSSVSEHWVAEFEQNITLISNSDIDIPVQYSPSRITLSNTDMGRFVFSQGKLSSVTKTPIVTHNRTQQATHRPTLFITIGGFEFGGGYEEWAAEYFHNKIKDTLIQHQYKHYYIDWDSHQISTRRAATDLVNQVVGDFLEDRIYEWDVVVVGHSRGGIFAHELSKKLLGHPKINDYYTVLLDPTASSFHTDIYPSRKHEVNGKYHYGSLFVDGVGFANVPNSEFYTNGGLTDSDRPIPGYSMSGVDNASNCSGSSHVCLPRHWIESGNGLSSLLSFMFSRKDTGTFEVDGDGALSEVLSVSIEKEITFDAELQVADGNVAAWVELTGGELTIVYLEASAGADGANLAFATALSSISATVNEDQVTVSSSQLFNSYSFAVNRDGLFIAGSSVGAISAQSIVNSDTISVDIDILGYDISGSADTSDTVNSIFPGVGGLF